MVGNVWGFMFSSKSRESFNVDDRKDGRHFSRYPKDEDFEALKANCLA
jgi:hypothetical protein